MTGRMGENLQALSENEKVTLRLLLKGHDAKSIATELGLSVHTVNERLRTARRKLGASSSREAARSLAAIEGGTPEILVDKDLGEAAAAGDVEADAPSNMRRGLDIAPAWLVGGVLIMLLIVAATAAILSFGNQDPQSVQAPGAAAAQSAAKAPAGAEGESVGSADRWIALLDEQRWADSWKTAGTLFKSQIPMAQWESTIKASLQPLGKISSRVRQSVTTATTLPGAPDGQYEIIQFQTAFAQKPSAVETVFMAREGADWKVIGYFIR